jgi:hypothetical protein
VAEDGELTASATVATAGKLVATDADGDALTYSIVTPPTKGMVSITGMTTGDYMFSPLAGQTGTDTFTFKANDGKDDSNEATVTITLGGNVPPVAEDGVLSVEVGKTATGTLVASDADGDALTISVVSQPAQGTVTVTDAATGAYTFDATGISATGTTTFTFKANDGTVDSNTATVTVTVTRVNTAPVAENGTVTLEAGDSVTDDVVATDEDEDTLSYSIVDQPTQGTVSIADDASYTYIANEDASGTDTFTFKANDGIADSNVATITVTITEEATGASDADVNGDFKIQLSELMRIQQIYTKGGYFCDQAQVYADGEVVIDGITYHDGYSINGGDQEGTAHSSDYKSEDADGSEVFVPDWKINLSEFLRVTQIYNLGGYCIAADIGQIDEEGDGLIPKGGPGCP